ncbi:hypothetical protein ACHAXT_003201 [Thalassiosira profunda]
MSSTLPALSVAPLKPCDICSGESCVVIPSIASQQHLCLLHYYTTGAHRIPPRSSANTTHATSKKKSASLLVESNRMDGQLPKVQDLFAEAFIDLQKEIGEESARQFQSAAKSDDPLGVLLGGGSASAPVTKSTRPLFRKPPRRRDAHANASLGKNAARQKEDDSKEGGFIRETVLPEKLRKKNESFEGYASKYSKDSKGVPHKRSVATSNASNTKKKPVNPYQRKHNPPQNIWNQVLDSTNDSRGKQKKQKIRYDDLEKELISNITSGNDAKSCTCGSTNVEVSGNATSRNDMSMTKGEVWGSKDREEVAAERCHCLDCGKRWNEE